MSMSAADWTRIQRRRAGFRYESEVTSATRIIKGQAPQQPAGTALLIPRDVGVPKTQRPASDFTNHIASRAADYYFKTQGSGREGETGDNNAYTRLRITRLCNCTTRNMDSKTGLCAVCLK
jgi:hypothetical protein